jgi:hypothetical protein
MIVAPRATHSTSVKNFFHIVEGVVAAMRQWLRLPALSKALC